MSHTNHRPAPGAEGNPQTAWPLQLVPEGEGSALPGGVAGLYRDARRTGTQSAPSKGAQKAGEQGSGRGWRKFKERGSSPVGDQPVPGWLVLSLGDLLSSRQRPFEQCELEKVVVLGIYTKHLLCCFSFLSFSSPVFFKLVLSTDSKSGF